MPAENEPAEPNALMQSLQLTCSLTPSSTSPSTRLVIIWLKRWSARPLIVFALFPAPVGVGEGVGETEGVGVGVGVDVGVGVAVEVADGVGVGQDEAARLSTLQPLCAAAGTACTARANPAPATASISGAKPR